MSTRLLTDSIPSLYLPFNLPIPVKEYQLDNCHIQTCQLSRVQARRNVFCLARLNTSDEVVKKYKGGPGHAPPPQKKKNNPSVNACFPSLRARMGLRRFAQNTRTKIALLENALAKAVQRKGVRGHDPPEKKTTKKKTKNK